jgi:hypothetical protein
VRRANGESTPKTLARERQLLSKHGRTWLGPLAAVVPLATAVFERGFLERCHAEARNKAMADVHFDRPEWATVRAIRFGKHSRVTAAMRALREAGPLDDAALKPLLLHGHPTLERVDLHSSALAVPSSKLGQAFLRCEKLPALRHLDLHCSAVEQTARGVRSRRVADFAWLWDAPWAKQLLSLGMPCREGGSEWSEVLATREHLEELRLHSENGIAARLRRAPDGIVLTLHINDHPGAWPDGAPYYLIVALQAQIGSFASAPRIRELHVTASSAIPFSDDQRGQLRDAASRIGALRAMTLPLP